jgi:hypothetical protein
MISVHWIRALASDFGVGFFVTVTVSQRVVTAKKARVSLIGESADALD